MDQKFAENLGMSNNVDEGLWDRLKSRASGYAQAARNLSGKGSTEVESANFNSLFKTFLRKSIRSIEDLARVLSPYMDAKKLTPSQDAEAQRIFECHWLMRNMEEMPITEANFFTRPFSVLGAQASGKVDNIINVYKKQLETYYNSFVADATKLNIVPVQYITRKIAVKYPEANEFLQKFGEIIGKNIVTGPATSPTPAAATTAPTTAAAPTPSPTPSPAPTAPSATSTATPASSAAGTTGGNDLGSLYKAYKDADEYNKSLTPGDPNFIASEIKVNAAWDAYHAAKQLAIAAAHAQPGAPVPQASPPTPPTPAPTSAPQSPPSPVAPASPASTNFTPTSNFGSSPVAPAATTTTSHSGAASASSSTTAVPIDESVKTLTLAKKAIDKIVTELVKVQTEGKLNEENDEDLNDAEEDSKMNMAGLIRKYLKRDANKAQYPFPKTNPVEFVSPDGKTKTYWPLRYKYAKDISGHSIDFYSEDVEVDPATKRETVTRKDDIWQPFLKFNAADLYDNQAKFNQNFDVLGNIEKCNRALAVEIKEGERTSGQPFIDPATHKKLLEALEVIVFADAKEEHRGKRQLDIGDQPDVSGRSGIGGATLQPPGAPQAPTTGDSSAPPDQQGRVGKTGKPEIPASLTGGVPVIVKQELEKQEQEKAKAKGKAAPAGKKDPAKKPAAPAKKNRDGTLPPDVVPPQTGPEKKPPTPAEIRKQEAERAEKLKKRIGVKESLAFKDFYRF